ncbi:unnamed protein product [Adineta steineri]|uniref:Uncharacterized protein n=1 Tax=Adineta steineri TaxID=433720 RepID=A0A813MZW4_9BILA|nr:unnamed protein product [Adineta steineri]
MNFRSFGSGKVTPAQQSSTDKQNDMVVAELLKEGCHLAEKDTPEDWKKAIEKFSKIRTLNVDMLYLRGNVHLKLGIFRHYQEAIDDFTEAIRLTKASGSLSGEFKYTAELYYKRAFAHQMLGENDDAIHDYSLFIGCAHDKGNHFLAKGYLSRGLVYESMQRMDKAWCDINKASELTCKKNPYYEYCRERVRIAISEIHGNMDDEHEYINDSVRENGNDVEDQDNEELMNSETPASMGQQMDLNVTIQESRVKYEKLFYDALLRSEQGHIEKALEKFKNACEITSNKDQKAESLFRQGLCYYQLHDKSQARNSFETARKYNPKHARAIFRLGMMQAADNHLKNAIQTLSLAYQHAPNDVDILYERANVFERLGKLQEAVYDRRRAMQLSQSSNTTIIMLEDRIRHIKAEIVKEGESSIRHFKIGWLEETRQWFFKTENSYIHEDKKKIINVTKTSNSLYKEAINEYKAAIYVDKEQCCPEAHAFMSLCQDQVKDILFAQEALQKLLEMLRTLPQFLSMWKLFIENVKNPNYWNEMGTLPPDRRLNKVYEIDRHRIDIELDEESFKDDENLLLFYRTCRVQLANVLSNCALAGCPKEIIAHNLKGRYYQAAQVVKTISPLLGAIPVAGSAIQTGSDMAATYLEDKDYELIRDKLEIISRCGDIIEQSNIGRRVARRLTDRYHEQLKRLHSKNKEINESYYTWCIRKLPCIESPDTDEPAKRVATFAVNYIISAITNQSIKTLKLKTVKDNKDVLVEILVELACRAHGSCCSIPKWFYDDSNQYLPLKPILNNTLVDQQQPISEEQNSGTAKCATTTTTHHADPIPEPNISITGYFTLSEFFRAPGLRYDHQENLRYGFGPKEDQQFMESPDNKGKNDNQKVSTSQPLTTNDAIAAKQNEDSKDGEQWAEYSYMKAEHYGYRLCSIQELKVLKYEPLNPYRSVIGDNPIEEHFTNRRLRKHMRHVGLIPEPPKHGNRESTSLVHDEHRIHNSEPERYKRFRRKFIVAMADTVEEVDRARQAEFRNQLELWDKMYSNRIQRIKAYDRKLERKYGLFVNKEIKKQLIQENLPKMPDIPSVSVPRILPHFVANRSTRRAASAKARNRPSNISPRQYPNREHANSDELAERLIKLENIFSTFEREDFHECRMNVNLLKMNVELLTNDKNIVQDDLNKLKNDFEELQTDLNDIVKDQDMLKIIQTEHDQKLSQLTLLVTTFQNQMKNISTSSSASRTKNYDEDLSSIQDKQEQFDASLQTIVKNMEILQTSVNTTDNGINQLSDKIIVQQQQIENVINGNLNALEQKMATLQEELKKIIDESVKRIKRETTILNDKVENLERAIDGMNLPHTKKLNTLPFVEKLAPMDLLEINWCKYQEENKND